MWIFTNFKEQFFIEHLKSSVSGGLKHDMDMNLFFNWFFFWTQPSKWLHNFKMAVMEIFFIIITCKMILNKN